MNFPRRLLITAIIALQALTSMAIGRGFGSDLSSAEGVLQHHLDSLSLGTTASDSIDISMACSTCSRPTDVRQWATNCIG
ncbi:MAG: hypothetical protein K2N76_06100 [Muribaculaceae bacterium]|nr:hypothetical protein [Muribaculaceae bacterium]